MCLPWSAIAPSGSWRARHIVLALVVLITAILISALLVKVGTVALTMTGMDRSKAAFQAKSAGKRNRGRARLQAVDTIRNGAEIV